MQFDATAVQFIERVGLVSQNHLMEMSFLSTSRKIKSFNHHLGEIIKAVFTSRCRVNGQRNMKPDSAYRMHIIMKNFRTFFQTQLEGLKLKTLSSEDLLLLEAFN